MNLNFWGSKLRIPFFLAHSYYHITCVLNRYWYDLIIPLNFLGKDKIFSKIISDKCATKKLLGTEEDFYILCYKNVHFSTSYTIFIYRVDQYADIFIGVFSDGHAILEKPLH